MGRIHPPGLETPHNTDTVHYFSDQRNGVLTWAVIGGNKGATEGDKTMFKTYAEAQNWIEAGQAKHGKRAFTSRPEYAEAYAEMTALFHAENPNYKKPNRKNATRIGAASVNLLAHGLT